MNSDKNMMFIQTFLLKNQDQQSTINSMIRNTFFIGTPIQETMQIKKM